MEVPKSPTKTAARPRSRKSIAHFSSAEMMSNKENQTDIVTEAPALVSPSKIGTKKARSKSIGPGGLDALRNESGNRQRSAMVVQYKSILKPTVPLSPPKVIPPHISARTTSPTKSKHKSSPAKSRMGNLVDNSESEDVLLFSLGNDAGSHRVETTSPSVLASPDRGQKRVAVRTEEQQQAAVEERERQEMLARKDARRKSLANRRVSFAPEATLHTWDVVEMPEDSTTSSASTNSTRRASSLTAQAASPYSQPRSPLPGSDASEPPSTPPQQVDEVQVAASPAHQRNLHQKKRRRSSGIPPMNFNNPDDFSSSPHSTGSNDTDISDHVLTDVEVDVPSSDSEDKDLVEDETVTGIDRDDATKQSDDNSMTGSSGRLEEALRQAAKQAGTQGIDFDEHGDITMEIADDEVTAAFKPWMNRGTHEPGILGPPTSQRDREDTNPFSPAFKAEIQETNDEDVEETMELTKAVGVILSPRKRLNHITQLTASKSPTYDRNRKVESGRRSSSPRSDLGDETMELTMAVGGIEEIGNAALDDDIENQRVGSDEDEGLSMDFTAVVGGLLSQKIGSFNQDDMVLKRRPTELPKDKIEVDQSNRMLVQDGQPSFIERSDFAEDNTTDMEMTTAIGTIVPEQPELDNRNQDTVRMDQVLENQKISGRVSHSAQEPPPKGWTSTPTESGSPGLVAAQQHHAKSAVESVRQSTPKLLSRTSSPAKKPATPSRQVTPKVVRPITPGKTPPSKNVSMRTGSPKRLFKAEINQVTSSPVQGKLEEDLTSLDSSAVYMARAKQNSNAQLRRTSGLGLDRTGLGSPRVTEMLNRRSSISESSTAFLSDGKPWEGVRFADPRLLEHQLDQERLEDERCESEHSILQGANDQNVLKRDITGNLKDKIQSLTPQKKRLNGRKSLHVGAAKGLLGKRPAELDEEEDEDDITSKQLRALQTSPVKKVKLAPPPSKNTTSGRVTRSARLSLTETSNNVRPPSPSTGASELEAGHAKIPGGQPPHKDVEHAAEAVGGALDLEAESAAAKSIATRHTKRDDRIHLQDFLNLTSIRFMELTTTKRRHTVAPNPLLDTANDGVDGISFTNADRQLENCVVAGACTLPMLDLYQHSCRELKKYIAEGRHIVREIEAETFQDNPILFREYISAPADVKLVMDNQFKNVKTHARLLSKAMWYEWRMKLLDGLKEGLLKNAEGMDEDTQHLTEQENLIRAALPELNVEHERLTKQVSILQARAEELASCDQEELNSMRTNLLAIENCISAKTSSVDELQGQLMQAELCMKNAVERKHECHAEILEAEKVREECQGWESSDIQVLEENVKSLERDHGWTVVSAIDNTLTMTFRGALQLYFSPGVFRRNDAHEDIADSDNAPIRLTYIADSHEHHPQSLSTEKRFFLQFMRALLQSLQQSHVLIKDLLHFISSSWQRACQIAEEVQMLGNHFRTEPAILSDENMAINSSVLLRATRTKVNIAFEVGIRAREGVAGLDVTVKPSARVVYGESLNRKKMGDFLEQKLSARKERHGEGIRWVQVVGELEERLIARGRK